MPKVFRVMSLQLYQKMSVNAHGRGCIAREILNASLCYHKICNFFSSSYWAVFSPLTIHNEQKQRSSVWSAMGQIELSGTVKFGACQLPMKVTRGQHNHVYLKM